MRSAIHHALFSPFLVLFQHRTLTLEMARREILDRYAGQVLGVLWMVGHPLIQVAVYIFIFQVVFQVRIGASADNPMDYTVYLLSGLLPWLAFQESMTRGTLVIVGNSNLVKQVVFPLEVLPVKNVLACWATQLIGTALLLAYMVITTGGVPWTIVLLPVLWAAQCLAMIGVSCLLGAVGAYFRDMKDLIQVFCVVGVYLMPICYLPQWVPEVLRPFLYLNPFSYMSWCYQDVCFYGTVAHPWSWPIFLVGSGVVFVLGFSAFRRLKTYFGNLL
ncbi:MAG: ABC transporter permease [Planctomycetes bacterium]|nr:ABC transporter permease [Planctomycetota bacterium]